MQQQILITFVDNFLFGSPHTESITSTEPLNHVSTTILQSVLLLVVYNNNKYSSHVVDNIIFGISVLDFHSITVETTFL